MPGLRRLPASVGRLIDLLRLLVAATALASCSPSWSQALDGPLRIVVGYAPGGASDRAARLMADALSHRLGVPVIVENRTGGGGRVAARFVKSSAAADNVLLLGNPAINVIAPLVFDNVGYDPYSDFVPVSQLTRYEFAIAVARSLTATTLSHLLEWLKTNPAKANVGIPATGSLPHFLALMLGDEAGVRVQAISYRGSTPLITDLIGEQIPVAISALDALLPLHVAGRLRILATSGAERSSQAPQIPTLKESGIDIVAEGWNVLFAPASMPPERVAHLGQAIADAMNDPVTQQRFRSARMTPVASTPQQTARMLSSYRGVWEPAIMGASVRP